VKFITALLILTKAMLDHLQRLLEFSDRFRFWWEFAV